MALATILCALLSFCAQDVERLDFAVVTHPDNRTTSVTREQLIKFFRAERRYWDRNHGVRLLLPRSATTTKRFLLDEVYEMSEPELKRYWIELVYRNLIPSPPKVMPSALVTLLVAKRRRGSLAIVEAESCAGRKDVKLLKVDGKLPGDAGYWPTTMREHTQARSVRRVARAQPVAWIPHPRPSTPWPKVVERAQEEDEPKEDYGALLRRVQALEELIEVGLELDETPDDDEFGPGFLLRGFADITFGARDTRTRDPLFRDGNGFAVGQLDLYLASKLGEQVSFLAETIFEADQDGGTMVDVERLFLRYDFGNVASVRVGRFHTDLGYWNTAFNHGEWLQTSIGRPRIVEFEDEGGLLPVHMIGLALESTHSFEHVELRADLEVGNGRGPVPDPPQTFGDGNGPKAVNFALSARPTAVDGLALGVGAYHDRIPPNTDASRGPLHGAINETILNASITYRGNGYRFLGEFFHIGHSAQTHSDSTGYHLQFELSSPTWTPYARFESFDLDATDTFFPSVDDLTRYTLGLRWDVSTWNAIKLQLAYSDFDSPTGGFDRDELELMIQTAFAF